MIQSGSLTPTALAWVREDLDKELDKVRLQVESLAASPAATEVQIDGTAGRVEELNQIFNTLVLDGAKQITGEMHRVLLSMSNGKMHDREPANAALLDAMVVLPAYLDRLQAGHQDLPMLLLPLINQMRAAIGEEALTEGTVFTPLLDVELPELEFVRKPGFDEPFEFLTNRLHRQFENALQNWLQEQDEVSLLSPMQGICETMRHRVKRYDLKRLWWVATELFGGLMDGHIDNNVDLRRLMARMSLLIKTMSDQGEDGIDERASTSVTQALLFHIGKAKAGCQGVDLVRDRFELDKLAPDSDAMMRARGTLSGQDRAMYTSLSAAVEDELSIVKDALDLELRTGQVEPDSRQQSMEALLRLADTLSMLGLSGPGRTITALVPEFEETAGAEVTERVAALEKMAEQLLLVESALTEKIETLGEVVDGDEQESLTGLTAHEVRRIRVKVLDECVTSMHEAEDAVRERFSGKVADPSEPLQQISGALTLISESESAIAIHELAGLLQRLEDHGREGFQLDDPTREQIADAMAAMELFLAARRDAQRDTTHYIGLARERMAQTAATIAAGSASTSAMPEAQAEAVPEPAQAAQEYAAQEYAAQDRAGTEEEVTEHEAEAAQHPEPAVDPAPELSTGPESEGDELTEPESERQAEPPAEPPAEPETESAQEAESVSASAVAAEDDTLPPEIDPDLREIFLEEYEEVLQSLQSAIPVWLNQPDNADALTDIRRAFHTLKGSGRMVGADELGDFSWQIENMLNTLLEGRGENFADASVMVRLAEASLPALRQRLLQEQSGLSQKVVMSIAGCAEEIARNQPASWGDLQPLLPVYLAGLLPGGFTPSKQERSATTADDSSDEMRALLKTELSANLGPIRQLMDAIAQDRSTRASEEQVRAVHTIAGLLAMHPEGLDAEVAAALETLLAAQSRSGKDYTPDAMFTVISAVGQLQNRVERLDGIGDLSPVEEQQELIGQLEQLTPLFDGPYVEPSEPGPAAPVIDEKPVFDPGHSVYGEADEHSEPASVDKTPEADASPEPVFAEPVSEEPVFAQDEEKDEDEPESLAAMLDADTEAEAEAEADFGAELPDIDTSQPDFSEPEPTRVVAPQEPAINDPKPFVPPPVVMPEPQPIAAETQSAAEDDAGSFEDLDQEIIGIFLEEAAEVLERGETALNQWRDNLDDLNWVQELQREIHTFKGGARMAGLMSIGDYSHEMESLLERIADRTSSPTLSAVQVLEEACDRLLGWVDEVQAGRIPQAGAALGLLNQQIAALDGITLPPDETQASKPAAEPVEKPAPQPVVEPPATPAAEAAVDADETMTGGSIKVPAELLDRLVNASGEVSIFRSRLEQQIGKLKGNLSEFDETIERLSEQFRKMDIEIEAQIRANYPDAIDAQGDSFDPLELDQFSALQQATRSLQESVADLLSLQEMAEENLRASEQLLTRQSRVSTELQEGLMKTRMVPFASVAPRLRRIVRGAAKDEGKQARLQVQMVGSSDELDRNVLEHITTPLEHMMRNAVAHGIESPQKRSEQGKPAEGAITITVESEATEFVIRISDDGGGINLDAIHRRAIERGLLDQDSEPTRQQLYAFMMDSGFSTSSSITKVAGRGVGMDVVNSDIKQIGGSLEIESEPGQGTQFTIRIPFTLAIMQAIGLEAGDAKYLLPLSSVVGVSRIMPEDYRKLLEQDEPLYRFAGHDYPILDIEPLLGERPTPLGRDNVSLLILRAGEQRAAIRAPNLLPHREVVIKPVGPQISSVAGVLGGSISGDGEVMVILDPGPMIRRALIHGVATPDESAYAPINSGKLLVMVVDDSITMRKVTSRVLESRDFEVITARDGVDALEQLQDRTPDIMLFDIEMPRMDGYELTERVRDDGRFRQTPIMMITSRAGQKHQDRAMQAGATAYLTKPYREDELLSEVDRLLTEAKQKHGQ